MEKIQTVPRGFWWPVGRVPGKFAKPLLPLRLFGHNYMLRRVSENRYAVQLRYCPHQDADLLDGKLLTTGALQCPYHGLQFDQSGQCTLIPQCPKASIDPRNTIDANILAEVRFGWLWVTSGAPLTEGACIPDFSQFGFGNSGWSNPVYGREIRRVNWRRCLENIIDYGHVDFVHPAFATPGSAEHQYKLAHKDNVVSMRIDFNNPANSPVQRILRFDRGQSLSVGTLVEWCTLAPGVLQLTITLPWSKIVTIVGLTPIEEDLTAINWIVLRNSVLRTPILDPLYYAASKLVLAQDGKILDKLGRKFVSDDQLLNDSDGPIKLVRNLMRGIITRAGAFDTD